MLGILTIKNLIMILIITLSLGHCSAVEIAGSTFVYEIVKAKNEQ